MKNILDKFHLPGWLLVVLVLSFILRIPSFFEPYSYGDQMIYLSMGEGVRQGLTLYKDLHDNKPPLLYLLAAAAGNLFWFKAILAFWNFFTIILFWKLANVLFPSGPKVTQEKRQSNEKLQKVATTIFALLTTLPLLEGNIVNSELFMIGPIIGAIIIIFTCKDTFKNLFLAGTLFSAASLFKIPAAFDLPAVIVFWLILSDFKKDSLLKIAKNSLVLALGFATPILITLIYYFFAGALKEYFIAAFMQNVGYLSSFRPGDVQKSFLVRNLPLILRGLIVVTGSGVLFIFRKKLSRPFIFVTLWLLFGLFAVTLSERPYPHYLVQIVPELAILLAILFTQKSFEQVLVLIPLMLTFWAPVIYKFWHYPTLPYYQRFVRFALGQTSKNEYFAQFGGEVNTNYQVADFITKSTGPKDKIFVTGDTPTVYALSRHLPPLKYLADYHLKDFSTPEQTILALRTNKPKLIVISTGSQPFPEIYPLLKESYIPITNINQTEIWLRINRP